MVKKVFARGATVLLSLLIGLIIIEVGMRFARPLLPPPIQLMLRDVKKHPFTHETILPPAAWRPVGNYQMAVIPDLDDQLQYPNASVHFQLSSKNWLDPNSQIGFRVDSLDWEPTWPVDIVTIGDSFTFCFTEYEECWVQRLTTDYGYSVVNLGQGATGSVSHTNILRTFALPYQPKVVLWQWYGNDNNEDYGFAYPGRKEAAPPPTLEIKNEWLTSNLVMFKLLDIFTNAGGQGHRGYEVQADTHSIQVAGEPIFFGRPYSYITADLSDEKNQLGQAIGFEALLEAKALLDQQGIELVVFPVPYKEEVYRSQIEAESDFDPAKIDQMEASRQAFIDFCVANGITYFDPTAELVAQAADGKSLYFSRDTHLNGTGNKALLELVQAQLSHLAVFDE